MSSSLYFLIVRLDYGQNRTSSHRGINIRSDTLQVVLKNCIFYRRVHVWGRNSHVIRTYPRTISFPRSINNCLCPFHMQRESLLEFSLSYRSKVVAMSMRGDALSRFPIFHFRCTLVQTIFFRKRQRKNYTHMQFLLLEK